jgi:hypothetical protein
MLRALQPNLSAGRFKNVINIVSHTAKLQLHRATQRLSKA